MPPVPILPSLPDGPTDLVIREITQRILRLENIQPPALPNQATLIRQVQLALQVGGPNALNTFGLLGTATGVGSGIVIGLHTVRLNSYPPAQQPVGMMFFETDRSALYVVALLGTLRAWILLVNRPFFAAAPPGSFGTGDTGFIYGRVAFDRTWTWTGAAWVDTPGMPPRQMVAYFNTATVPTGWALCDGSSVTISTATAGTSAGYVTPDLITNNPLIRGAAAAGGTNTINGTNGVDFTIHESELVPMIRL